MRQSLVSLLTLVPLASGITITMPLIDQAGVDMLNYAFEDQAKVQQILTHGCWCAKLDPNQSSTELGGSAIDRLDGFCHSWFKARKCSVEFANDCTESQSLWLSYTISDNVCTDASTSTNPDADTSCKLATCNIDAWFAAAIYNYVTDNAWSSPVTGDSSTCLKNGHGKSCQGYPYEDYNTWTLP
jgi:hypothetical protein